MFFCGSGEQSIAHNQSSTFTKVRIYHNLRYIIDYSDLYAIGACEKSRVWIIMSGSDRFKFAGWEQKKDNKRKMGTDIWLAIFLVNVVYLFRPATHTTLRGSGEKSRIHSHVQPKTYMNTIGETTFHLLRIFECKWNSAKKKKKLIGM